MLCLEIILIFIAPALFGEGKKLAVSNEKSWRDAAAQSRMRKAPRSSEGSPGSS